MDNSLAIDNAQRELEPNEQIVWVGQPDARMASSVGIAPALFGVLFMAGPIRAMKGLASGGSDGMFMVILAIPILIGICFLFSPLYYYIRAKGVLYVITSQRILIIQTGRSRSVESFRSIDMNEVKSTERRDGSGILTFARQPRRGRNGTYMADICFNAISNVREVENMLRQTFTGG